MKLHRSIEYAPLEAVSYFRVSPVRRAGPAVHSRQSTVLGLVIVVVIALAGAALFVNLACTT